jgi:hypothetical protein
LEETSMKKFLLGPVTALALLAGVAGVSAAEVAIAEFTSLDFWAC